MADAPPKRGPVVALLDSRLGGIRAKCQSHLRGPPVSSRASMVKRHSQMYRTELSTECLHQPITYDGGIFSVSLSSPASNNAGCASAQNQRHFSLTHTCLIV